MTAVATKPWEIRDKILPRVSHACQSSGRYFVDKTTLWSPPQYQYNLIIIIIIIIIIDESRPLNVQTFEFGDSGQSIIDQTQKLEH